ncbi:MAG TPA: patatin-like phospholipase family protein [Rhizomicrobium sp.]|jgi:NTE family protein|nr:patatin-like phospholipase family protein [Rhizomicrobium sp.]
MAFLSSFRNGSETVYPESLRARLRSFPLLEDLGEPALKRLLAQANWFGLPGGALLPRDGENDRALFLVVTGALGVFLEDEKSQRTMIAEVSAGETVGEMSLISGEAHSAQLVALRDTELLRISREGFQLLMTRHPHVVLNLMRILVKRLQVSTRPPAERTRPKTIAIVPLQPGLREESLARELVGVLQQMGASVAMLDASAADRAAEWFNRFEAAHNIVFYVGDTADSAWSHLCLRQSDRVFLLADGGQPLPRSFPEVPPYKARGSGGPQLLLRHQGGVAGWSSADFCTERGYFEAHHHLRAGVGEDLRRLARFVAGRAIGLVLAGGAARGYGHIGVARALIEAGVPFDRLGGTSMGAIVAAGLALEWDIDELTERMRDAFVINNPFSDMTLPLIALFRGRQVSALLRKHFGDIRIEEMPRPFFCVSSDLTLGRIHVHRAGPLWRALRASAAVPGILPPVTFDGHLFVDGGVMNNLPVDVMAAEGAGPVIASDVTGEIDLRVADSLYGERSLWSLVWQRMRGTPSIVSILMRSGTVGSEAQRRVVREQADFLFEPPMPDIGLRAWKSLDQAIAEGYAHARLRIEQHGIPLSDVWSDGPAVSMPQRAAE